MRDFPHHHRRPAWARRLDRALGRVIGPLGRLLGRPADDTLSALARQDRPAPAIAVPSPEDLGVTDHLADGRAALEENRHADALHHFRMLLEANPDHAWGWHGRGDALQLLGDPVAALEAYDTATALQPTEALHHGGRANALAAVGRHGDGDAARRHALRLDPTLSWMWSNSSD